MSRAEGSESALQLKVNFTSLKQSKITEPNRQEDTYVFFFKRGGKKGSEGVTQCKQPTLKK